ncbi:hypothetical protein IID26_00115 [Patescibacteria group bacterium]|nr:hypothetical protein [Patescibacteria group bacterium]
MKKSDDPSTPLDPFMFQFAEQVEVDVADASEPGIAMETDTKDPYSDCSDTI